MKHAEAAVFRGVELVETCGDCFGVDSGTRSAETTSKFQRRDLGKTYTICRQLRLFLDSGEGLST